MGSIYDGLIGITGIFLLARQVILSNWFLERMEIFLDTIVSKIEMAMQELGRKKFLFVVQVLMYIHRVPIVTWKCSATLFILPCIIGNKLELRTDRLFTSYEIAFVHSLFINGIVTWDI
ncbi:hypothetical protein Gasu2_03780 [Galdieria sulphuraria]|uniref:Uncharacterized protein n=1 Tax=Galdieria sulphuraria TaxID=130081 RepID=M2Y043_GALSU|nr:uncharacterized protein Gasu_32690 [Galdieria sulphuraria]EME29258.1 hypothetical protein Gasu_32690 [Galdieria sulphuraria]GJD05934.1 hypothetical protein Gasu2_03780 [Galdieria sulphuraria]|eukprot:XP_005705778.1 hypothetical protein Gasu_32690 [Galdieria sulphuraria]